MNTNKDKKLKDFKSLDEQIDLLEKRGLIIYDRLSIQVQHFIFMLH